MKSYRLVRKSFAPDAFTGEGAALYGGRWNSVGTRMVYTSGSIALATLEMIVNAGGIDSLADIRYVVYEVEFESSHCRVLEGHDLPGAWKKYPLDKLTMLIGDRWIEKRDSAVLRVPSAVIPMESNYLINPKHPATDSLKISGPLDYSLNTRLVK